MTSITAVIVGVALFAVSVQSQGVSQEDEDCNGCWMEMEYAITKAADYLRGDSYRHKGQDGANGQDRSKSANWLSQSQLNPSADSGSAECDACWTVLERLQTFTRSSRNKDVNILGRLVKKAMLNNGWSLVSRSGH